jgi:cyclophilin family peptidyl-prolyl cis-trans isomerase
MLALLAQPARAGQPQVLLETNLGNIVLELNEELAPKTVANFLRYIDEGFYSGTVFHRVIDGFMVQGGGMNAGMQEKAARAPVMNEASNGLKNVRGSVAMARTMDPHSATAQFFINLVDNRFLDFRGQTLRDWGYTVFGRVISGMDVVDKIAKLPTHTHPSGAQNVPTDLPVITSASRIVEAIE